MSLTASFTVAPARRYAVSRTIKNYVSGYYRVFPALHVTIDDMIVEGDKEATRWTLTGTHKGEIEGVPPSGKKMTIWEVRIERVVGGKFAETWERHDSLGFMQQISLVPKPGKGGK